MTDFAKVQAREIARLRAFIRHIADLSINDAPPHIAEVCGCPVHQAQRFLAEQPNRRSDRD